MSPNPTVLIVTIDQYSPRNIESYPFSGPSTRYMVDPTMTLMSSTTIRNTMILRELALIARTR